MTDETTPRARLFSPPNGRGGPEYWIADAATIGRDPGNQIVLSSKRVSKLQARITFDPEIGAYCLESLGRGAATRLDGVAVKGRVRLGDLNVVTFGDQDFIFVRTTGGSGESRPELSPKAPERLGKKPAASGPGTLLATVKKVLTPEFLSRDQRPREPESIPSPSAAEDHPETGGQSSVGREETVAGRKSRLAVPRFRSRPEEAAEDSVARGARDVGAASLPPSSPPVAAGETFLVVTLPLGDLEYPLSPGSHLVGRSEECDIRLQDSTVSRRHASLEVDSDGVTLKDLKSVNYTFLRDQRVTAPVPVPPGSALRFGSVKARIVVKRSDP